MSTTVILRIFFFQAKRWSKEVEETLDKEKSFSGEESQGKVSMGTSLEVQACSSVKAPFFRRKRVSRTLHKNNNTQVLRIKVNNQPTNVKKKKKREKNSITLCYHHNNRKSGMIAQ